MKAQRSHPYRAANLILASVLLLAATFAGTPRPAGQLAPAMAAAAAQPAAAGRPAAAAALSNKTYLPGVLSPFVETTGAGVYSLPYTLPNGGIMTNRLPQVAVDPAGGIHVVYTANAPDNNGLTPAYYGYCAANCSGPNSFTVISLGTDMEFAQLALTPGGRPRLLLITRPLVNGSLLDSPQHYLYAACDGGCTNQANWTVTDLTASFSYDFYEDPYNNQTFALDGQGNPRFAYFVNTWQAPAGQAGTHFAYCDGNCSNAGNWFDTKLTDTEWDKIALALTPTGLPRLMYEVSGGAPNYDWLIGYTECSSADCAAHTDTVLLTAAASGGAARYAYAMRIDSNGNPRVAYYPGSGTGGTLTPSNLYYLSCNGACSQAANWNSLQIGQAIGEWGIDLALDGQDRPRIAFRYNKDYELGYGWCNLQCETATADWHGQLIPSRNQVDLELGHTRFSCPTCIPPIPDCQSTWDVGYWPSLALDPAGNPRIVYEAQLISFGGCSVTTMARISRLATLPQP